LISSKKRRILFFLFYMWHIRHIWTTSNLNVLACASKTKREEKKKKFSWIWLDKSFLKNFCWGLESTPPRKFHHRIQLFTLFRMMYFVLTLHEKKIFEPVDIVVYIILFVSINLGIFYFRKLDLNEWRRWKLRRFHAWMYRCMEWTVDT